MEKRTLLAFILCLGIIYLWQATIKPPQRPLEERGEVVKKVDEIKELHDEELPKLLPKEEFKGEDIEVKHPLFIATFSTKGASIRSFALTKYKVDAKKDSKSINLVTEEQSNFLPLALYSNDPDWQNLSTLHFKVVKNANNILEFLYEDSKRSIRRKFLFKEGNYEFDIETIIDAKGNKPPSNVGLILSDVASAGEKPSMFNPGAQENMMSIYSSGEIERIPAKNLSTPILQKKSFDWIGFDSKYFLTAIIPSSDNEPIEIKGMIAGEKIALLRYLQAVHENKGEIVLRAKGYFGPKLLKQLELTGHNLKEAIDLGWFGIFAEPLLKLLNLFYKFFHNYGIAIILLTVLIKVLFYPLSQKSLKSMREMQRIQPQIQALKDQHKEDRERLNKEMMNMMKTNNVSPMGGCLPLLFQMPIFFALYRVLYSSVELFHAPFFGWIQDLSSKDPFFITPIAMGLLMVVQQKMTPSTMDPVQKRMMVMMPLVFTFLMLFLPAGLNLYMLVNSILTILQQHFFNKADAVSIKAKT